MLDNRLHGPASGRAAVIADRARVLRAIAVLVWCVWSPLQPTRPTCDLGLAWAGVV
jgi:hypothetical protein